MRKLFLLLTLFVFCLSASAQDTLILLTGKKIVVSSVDLKDYSIAYRKMNAGKKNGFAHGLIKIISPDVKTISFERVFSVVYRDGREQVVYQPDSLDALDFKVEEMRSFIYGEIDARKFYRNNFVKGSGFVVGGGAALLTIYGLVVPPLYSTVLGAFSPSVEKKLTFKVSGDAASTLGISPGKYLNRVTGTASNPVIKKDQQLVIGGKTIRFKNDANLDSTVTLINSYFDCHLVHASVENGQIKLYRSEVPSLINDAPYREGFEKRCRDYKIRNAMISGLIGFVAGSVALSIVLK